MASSTSILYHDSAYNIILIDVPRSLSLAQGENLRIVSSEPLEQHYPSTEPLKSLRQEDESIETLLLERHLRIALDELKSAHQGDSCLPRLVKYDHDDSLCPESSNKNRKLSRPIYDNDNCPPLSPIPIAATAFDGTSPFILDHRGKARFKALLEHSNTTIHIPSNSYAISGSISSTLPYFLNTSSPQSFDFIVLDPPWPNRSARRKGIYNTSRDLDSISDLLFSLPLNDEFSDGEVPVLAENGYVVVWITNKQSFRDMVICEGGLFEHWGIQLVEEWVWLKVTRSGEAVCKIDGVWRKPYEIALVGRKMKGRTPAEDGNGDRDGDGGVMRRVLIGVPDAHSRKPNLGEVFEAVHGKASERGSGKRLGLEIFARNMTAGAWAWGDQVFEYQDVECWEEYQDVECWEEDKQEFKAKSNLETSKDGRREGRESVENDT